MAFKPHYTLIYKNPETINELISKYPFKIDSPINIRKSKDYTFYEWEHMLLRCYQIYDLSEKQFLGHRTCQVFVEKGLIYDDDIRNLVLIPMMGVHHLIGGRVVEI